MCYAHEQLGRNALLKKLSLFAMFVVCLVFAGCSTLQTLTATENSISYEYNRNFDSSTSVAQRAFVHCEKYGKKAELRSRTISPSGNWNTDIFDCK
jgi:hypothetical protein